MCCPCVHSEYWTQSKKRSKMSGTNNVSPLAPRSPPAQLRVRTAFKQQSTAYFDPLRLPGLHATAGDYIQYFRQYLAFGIQIKETIQAMVKRDLVFAIMYGQEEAEAFTKWETSINRTIVQMSEHIGELLHYRQNQDISSEERTKVWASFRWEDVVPKTKLIRAMTTSLIQLYLSPTFEWSGYETRRREPRPTSAGTDCLPGRRARRHRREATPSTTTLPGQPLDLAMREEDN